LLSIARARKSVLLARSLLGLRLRRCRRECGRVVGSSTAAALVAWRSRAAAAYAPQRPTSATSSCRTNADRGGRLSLLGVAG